LTIEFTATADLSDILAFEIEIFMKLSGFELIRLFSSFQLLLMVTFLLSGARHRLPNALLAVFLFAQMAFTFGGVFYGANHNLATSFRPFFHVLFAFTYLLGPSIYLYVRILVKKTTVFQNSWWLHMSPFLVMLVVNPFFLEIPSTDFFLFGPKSLSSFYSITALLILYAQLLIYLGWALVILFRHKWMDENESALFRDHKRFRQFLTVIAGLWVVESMVYVTFVSADEFLCHVLILLAIAQFFVVNALVFQGLKSARSRASTLSTVKYQKTMLSASDRATYLEKIRYYMETARPYLDPEFGLQQLADATCVPAHHVSQVLNTTLKKNFWDFVNHYRIADSIKQLEGDKTILEILYAVGFTSKSSFNIAFKKQTGTTPTQYRKMLGAGDDLAKNSFQKSSFS
jgi:AraC-like DNA-binding protein